MKLYSKLSVISIALCFLAGCKQTTLVRPANSVPKTIPAQVPVCPPEAKRQPQYLTLEELTRAKEYYNLIDNKEMTIKYVEEMIKKASEPQQLEDLRLELADLYFELGKFEEAGKIYTLYISLYPGSQYRVYAHYQAILCRFYMSLSSDRDQTITQEALSLTQTYLRDAARDHIHYKKYEEDVTKIKTLCCDKLYESDQNIFDFYLKKGSIKACKTHLNEMKKRFEALATEEIKIKLLTLECKIAEAEKDTQLLALKKAELESKLGHAPVVMAQDSSAKKRAITRF